MYSGYINWYKISLSSDKGYWLFHSKSVSVPFALLSFPSQNVKHKIWWKWDCGGKVCDVPIKRDKNDRIHSLLDIFSRLIKYRIDGVKNVLREFIFHKESTGPKEPTVEENFVINIPTAYFLQYTLKFGASLIGKRNGERYGKS